MKKMLLHSLANVELTFLTRSVLPSTVLGIVYFNVHYLIINLKKMSFLINEWIMLNSASVILKHTKK
jgi:hypothetical protein